ncbi:OLC1v1002934C1 [Oldenlandia corymbosa var. corymbosa]|nr:OLC1v1002934C1 [Oldenlandia corymbosa var. corymbosa]
MDNALYPVLFLDYLKHSIPIFNLLVARIPALLGLTVSLTYLNYRGLHIVGFSAVLLASFSLFPFIVMGILSVPRIRPQRWFAVDFGKVDWRGYFNSLFWNLNYWDKASTVAGEVEDPRKTFPKALYGAVALVVCAYLIPLLSGTGAVKTDPSEWSDGYFAEVGMLIGGAWLKWWIQAASAMSNLGLFEAEMSSDAFQLLGMSEIGMLPSVFSLRSKYGTPTVSILCSATGVIFLSWMSFQEIIEFLNFLYSAGMLLEFAAFIRLRIKKPDLHRPYKVPLETFGATMLCIPPAFLLVLVMCLASLKTYLVSGTVIIFGFLLYPALVHMKNERWFQFKTAGEPSGRFKNDLEDQPVASEEPEEINDEASTSLLSELPSSKKDKGTQISSGATTLD